MEAMIGGSLGPEQLPGMTGGEAQTKAIGQRPDAATNREPAQAQRVHLHARHLPLAQPPQQGLQQPVGGRMQQQAARVGAEAMVAQTVGAAGDFAIRDPVLARAARDLPGRALRADRGEW